VTEFRELTKLEAIHLDYQRLSVFIAVMGPRQEVQDLDQDSNLQIKEQDTEICTVPRPR